MYHSNRKKEFKLVNLEGLPPERVFEKAKNYCFYFLDKKERSEYELKQKMSKKGYPIEVIEMTMQYLNEKNFLNDRRLLEGYVRQYIRESKGYRYVQQKLRLKGLSLNESLFNELFEQFSDTPAELKAHAWVSRKYKNYSTDPKVRKKAFDALIRRGFSFDLAKKTLSIKEED